MKLTTNDDGCLWMSVKGTRKAIQVIHQMANLHLEPDPRSTKTNCPKEREKDMGGKKKNIIMIRKSLFLKLVNGLWMSNKNVSD